MDNQKIVWLIKAAEPKPIIQGAKLERTGLLAEYLSLRGYQVVWWASTFIHAEKKYLYDKYTEINVKPNYKLELLHSDIAYMKNTSVKRIFYYNRLAKQFREKSANFKRPDIIICCHPPLSFVNEAIEYGKKHHVPVIVDVRDEWPDIFVRVFPAVMRTFANILLLPLKRQAHNAFKAADVITAVTPSRLAWGLSYAGRNKSPLDSVIYLGCRREAMQGALLVENLEAWRQHGITEETWNICIFTTLSKSSMDIDTVIYAVRKLSRRYHNLRFVIGGLGDDFKHLKEISKDIPEVYMAGWLNQNQMQSLMKISKCGVLCYRNTPDFINAFGNKAMQYMSEGLPVITSAEGFAKEYFEQHRMGIVYKEGDVDDCAQKIEYLYENPQLTDQMAKNSLARFYTDFESDVVNSKFVKVIESVITK